MSIFENLTDIKTEKYHWKIQQSDVDARFNKHAIELLGNASPTKNLVIDGSSKFKLKERHFIAEIIFHFNTPKNSEENFEELQVKSKVLDEEYKNHPLEIVNSDTALSNIFALSDEIIISAKKPLQFTSIEIYYFKESDFSEMLSDISDIEAVVKELNSEKHNYEGFLEESDRLQRHIKEEENLLSNLSAKTKSAEVELKYTEEQLDKTEHQLQRKEELIGKRNHELSRLAKSLHKHNEELFSVRKEIGNYTDTLKGYRKQSRHSKDSYFLLIAVSLLLLTFPLN